jgi:hypothetical protein
MSPVIEQVPIIMIFTNKMYNERSDKHSVSHSGNMYIPCHALKSQLKRLVNETINIFQTKLHLKHY